MEDFDAASAIRLGGWDERYAVTLAVASYRDIAATLIDTNGDGADIDLDEYERDGNEDWQAICSGSTGESGSSWSPQIAAAWGRTEPGVQVEVEYLGSRYSVTTSDKGWWLFIRPATDDSQAVPRPTGSRP